MSKEDSVGSKFVINSLPKTARKRNLVTPGLKNHAKRLFGPRMLAFKRSTSIDESVLIKNAALIKKMTDAGLFEVRIDSITGPVLDLADILVPSPEPEKKTPATPPPPPPIVESPEEEDEVIGGEYSTKTKGELISMLRESGVKTAKGELKKLKKSELIVMLRERS